VRSGETVSISGGQLEATGDARIALKGDEPSPRPEPVDESSTPPRGWGLWQLLLGYEDVSVANGSGLSSSTVGSGSGGASRIFATGSSLQYGITDRFEWAFPAAFAYRISTAGRFEVIPFGGISNLNLQVVSDLGPILTLNAGVDTPPLDSP
jgi:hypothetical protein